MVPGSLLCWVRSSTFRRNSSTLRKSPPDQPQRLPIFSSPGVMQIVVEGREGSRLGKE